MNIKCISKTEAKTFLQKYHYLGSKPFRHSFIYGLIDETVNFGIASLKGVCVFHGVSAPETVVGAFGLKRENQHGFYELGRLAIDPELNGGNTTSWFVSRVIKQLSKDTEVKAIISYADSSAGHIGSIYRACNALYCGVTAPKSDFFVGDKVQERGGTRGVVGEWKPRSQKHRYVWVFDPTLELKWEVIACNWKGIPKNIKINQKPK